MLDRIPFLLAIVLFCVDGLAQENIIHFEKGVHVQTVNQWTTSLSRVSNVDSTTYIRKKSGGFDKLHKSGHRDVIIWIPRSTDLSKNFTLLIWFHGHWGFVPKRTFEDRVLKQVVPFANNKNFVVAIPEMPWSVHTSTPTKRNSMLWEKPGDFLLFMNQLTQLLESHNRNRQLGSVDYRIVGHSAGGSAIKRIAITGDLCHLEPTMVIWSDSSYGNWLDTAWESCFKEGPSIDVRVFVVEGDSPWRNAVRFINKFRKPPSNIKIFVKKKPGWSHKAIGNNIVELSEVLQ